ncbi:MAG TPA: hypothetical protein VGI39_16730 [Polyangiaceae bacterium]|jgi:hypothetical protein
MHSLSAGRRAAWGGIFLFTSFLTAGFVSGCGGGQSDNPPKSPDAGEAGSQGVPEAGTDGGSEAGPGDEGGTTLEAGTGEGGPSGNPEGGVVPDGGSGIFAAVPTPGIAKIDLLFMIDNSASMGDKQSYLEAAIPDLITRLVTPNCLDDANPSKVDSVSTLNANGVAACPAGQHLEFPGVPDMHVGIVSSSLGPRLGDKVGNGQGGACLATSTITLGGTPVSNHNDDDGHLLTRAATPGQVPPNEAPLPDAAAGFLAWYPSGPNAGTPPPNAVTTASQLKTDFVDLVAGAGAYGCGIESQLESWYRFLVQPDPYDHLDLDANKHAEWVGVDTVILKQRHDFLRPDSVVAIVDLTDENDSEIDARSIGGQGYLFMGTNFYPPHGTSACATNPADPACTNCPSGSTDPACTANPSGYNQPTDWGYDLNLRHVHMKAKYGLDAQFPVQRYADGLSSATIPDRNGEYPPSASNYVGNKNCTNPLFAASLPDGTGLSNPTGAMSAADEATLCNLPHGLRAPSSVFFTVIGGVPAGLLHYDPASAANSALSAADWVKILGTDPEQYNYAGIDPHMIESYQPRSAGSPGAPTFPTAPLTGNETALGAPDGGSTDPWNGREWVTNVGNHVDLAVDREYACIFPLTTPRDCTVADNRFDCDCSSTGLSPDELSPVCDPATPTLQKFAKAYPTTRELLLAKKLGTQGIVSSICPTDVADNAAQNDPLYGYRPAVGALVNHLKGAFQSECLPQALPAPHIATVDCRMFAFLPQPGAQSACAPVGLTAPDPTTTADVRSRREAQWLAQGGTATGLPDPNTLPLCEIIQVAAPAGGTCAAAAGPEWCYLTGAAAGTCAQSIAFSATAVPNNATVTLVCPSP